MDHDQCARREPPQIKGRGEGHVIRFMCPKCITPSNQRGSRLKFFKGLKQRVCGECASKMEAV